MKQNYKKTFWGSILAFLIGTSCCWLSSLAIWIGGATTLGVISSFIENIQTQIIVLGVILSILSILLYFRNTKS